MRNSLGATGFASALMEQSDVEFGRVRGNAPFIDNDRRCEPTFAQTASARIVIQADPRQPALLKGALPSTLPDFSITVPEINKVMG